MSKNKKLPEEINVNTWWKPGTGMIYNRYTLPSNHPEHIYNYILREHKVNPEEYGIEKPISVDRCPACDFLIENYKIGKRKETIKDYVINMIRPREI